MTLKSVSFLQTLQTNLLTPALGNIMRGVGGGGGDSCTLLLPARPKLLYTLFYSGIGVGVQARDSTRYIGQNISTSKINRKNKREKKNRTVPHPPPPPVPILYAYGESAAKLTVLLELFSVMNLY